MSLSYKTLGREDVFFVLNLTRKADSAAPYTRTKKMISSHSVRLG